MSCWKLLVVLSIFITGCATNYVEVPIESSHATITFQRNTEGVKAVNNEPYQDYNIMDNPQCNNLASIARFSFDKEFIKTARFKADKNLHFYMHSVPNQNIYGNWCWSYLGFTPEVGKNYVMMHVDCKPVVYLSENDEWEPVEDLDVINDFECPKN